MIKYDLPKSVLEIWTCSQDMQTNMKKTFFSRNIRMCGKNINLMMKRSTRVAFIKKLFSMYDRNVNKILVSKKESNVKIISFK